MEDQDEVAQDFSCMLAHNQVTFRRVVDFGIDTTAPTIGLSRVPKKTTKKTLRVIWYHMLVPCCTNPKKEKLPRVMLVPALQQQNYYLDTEREKSNPTL